MTSEQDYLESHFLSVDLLQEWLQHEMCNLTKEVELRKKEATGFVEAYARGELTPEQATDSYHRYQHRWFTPLEGKYAAFFDSDEVLMAAIDASRGPYLPMRELYQEEERKRRIKAKGNQEKERGRE